MGDVLATALRHAAVGHQVFPLASSKRPVANCDRCRDADHDRQACPCLLCHGLYAATGDPERIAAMLAAVPRPLLAVRTGQPSGVVVIDIDPGNGGDLAALIRRGLAPPTAHVVTGSGGWHLWYRWPGRLVPCSASRIAPGVDVRGDGGYVVVPPSAHPRTGRRYVWADRPREVVEMPSALAEACLPPSLSVQTRGEPVRPATASAEGISYPDRLLAAHLDAVARAPEGRRRVTLYGAARGAARMVAAGAITSGAAVAALTRAGYDAGQSERDTRRAISGGFEAEGVTW
ncbi:bifunctional DNA primase/polymerase [Natronosporangium hydrolyticum]|uniref:bifunctional DNA primase/polymerase n=1 Tax=Natronosporangium hydrolyticum TaxID=2811111 RepID=UPI001EFA17FA|nr:bifunctional DNA primase/polymerase [Natronosporangium hydrolyticum]